MTSTAYHHGDLQNAIIGQAVTLARAGGTGAITVREVARRVGVSHAAAYRHFPSRTGLLASVATEAMDDLASTLQSAVARGGRPLNQMKRLANSYVVWAWDQPGSFAVAFCEELWDKEPFPLLRAASDRASRPVIQVSEALLRVGPDDTRARQLALAAWAQVHGTAVLGLDRQLSQGALSLSDPRRESLALQVELAVEALVSGWQGARA